MAPGSGSTAVEPASLPTKALEDMVSTRVGNLEALPDIVGHFDIAFLTLCSLRGPTTIDGDGQRTRSFDAAWMMARLATDFSNWSGVCRRPALCS